MASESNHQHDDVYSLSPTDDTIARTLTSPSLPTLPFDLIPEILWRLPVNLLVQFRCVCKSWNTLISNPKFTEKHLHLSTTKLVLILSYPNLPSHKHVLKSYPLDTVFTGVTTNHIAQLEFPSNHVVRHVASCNGILCILATDAVGFVTVRLWNPSIRKFKELPSLEKHQNHSHIVMMYGFGYDVVSYDYKVVVVLQVRDNIGKRNYKQGVKVHTLGTNSWKIIMKFPFGYAARHGEGKFIRGTINWLVSSVGQRFIVSLDLGTEYYKKFLLPDDYGVVNAYILDWHLGVLRDCLCMTFGRDVWVMKEHGNKDSWTKLFTISYIPNFPAFHVDIEVLHMFEDGQVLLKSYEGWKWKLIFYNSRNGTFKFTQFGNNCEVCFESLISPCS